MVSCLQLLDLRVSQKLSDMNVSYHSNHISFMKNSHLCKCIRLCLNLRSCSHIIAIHFRKVNYYQVSERVETCITTTIFNYCNEIVPSYINKMFQPSLRMYNIRSQMTLDIPLWKTNTGQQALSFLGPEIETKISHSTKNLKI